MPNYPATGGGGPGLGGGQIFVAQNGSDANDGSDWQRAMLTGYAGYRKLVNQYGGGVLNLAGVINWGGPVTKQGMWFRGDGATVPGFLPCDNVTFNGYGQSTDSLFQRPGCAIIVAGATNSDAYEFRKKPSLWISKSQKLMTFNNIRINGFPFQPFRAGWDYFRNSDGTVQEITITGATRTSNVTTYTVTLPTGTAITSLSRTSNVVTASVAQPAGAATFPPYRVGQIVRVNTGGDPDFPDIDVSVATVVAALEDSSDWSFTYIQTGSDHAPKIIAGANVQSHGCGAFGEGEYIDLDSGSNTDFPATQYRVTGHTVNTITVADPWGGQPNNTGGTCPASATGTTIGTLCHQERLYASIQRPIFTNVNASIPSSLLYMYASGPCYDFGAAIAAGPQLYYCQTVGLSLPDIGMTVYPRDDDRMSAIFMAPGGPLCNAGSSIGVYNSSGADGGIRVRTGQNNGLVDVKNWVGDIGNSTRIPPAVDVIGNGTMIVDVDYAIQADNDATVPNVRVSNTPPNQIRVRRSGLVDAIGLAGDMNSAVWASSGAPNNPWTKGQITDWASLRITGNHPAGRRTMGPLGARYANRLDPISAWSGTGVTVTNGQPAPDGTNTAVKYTGASDKALFLRHSASDGATTFEVGGRVVLAGWFNAASGFNSNFIGATFVNGQITFAGSGTFGFNGTADYFGDGWQYMVIQDKIATLPGGATQVWGVTASALPTDIVLWGMSAFYVPAAIKDNDYYEFIGTLKHQPIYLPAGFVGTMEGQIMVAHGGLGTADRYVTGGGSGQVTIGADNGVAIPIRDELGVIVGWVPLKAGTINP